MRRMEKYAMLIEEVFGIQGVMALAWYMLSHHRYLVKTSGDRVRVPILIIEGEQGTGKTELVRAIAAVDVPQGLKPDVPIHLLPSMTSVLVNRLVNGPAKFAVLEKLTDGIPNKSVKAIKRRKQDGPLLMMTSPVSNENGMLADESVIVRLPKREFTSRDDALLDELHGQMKTAWQLKEAIIREPLDSLSDRMSEWRHRLKDELENTGLAAEAVQSQVLTDYYALILGHWQILNIGGRDMLLRLSDYAFRCLSIRVPAKDKVRKTLVEVQRRNGEEVTLIVTMAEGQEQRLVFADELMFKGFVHLLRLMDSTNAGKVSISV